MKSTYKSLTCAAALAAALPAAALEIRQDFAFSTDIAMNSAWFTVKPLGGEWFEPRTIEWDNEKQDFKGNGRATRDVLTIQSVADVMVRRTSDSGIIRDIDNAEIGMEMWIDIFGGGKWTITTSPTLIYDYSIEGGRPLDFIELIGRAKKDQITDDEGNSVPAPPPGRYDGTVSLIFESTI